MFDFEKKIDPELETVGRKMMITLVDGGKSIVVESIWEPEL